MSTPDVAPVGCSPGRPCSTFVRMFKPQFAALVESGEKCQTVRPTPKRMPKPGDRISLRAWTGAPYRSKQRVLREAEIVAVRRISIDFQTIILDGAPLDQVERYAFATADGFTSWPDMGQWFLAAHGLPFDGIVIYWSNVRDHRRRPAGGRGALAARVTAGCRSVHRSVRFFLFSSLMLRGKAVDIFGG